MPASSPPQCYPQRPGLTVAENSQLYLQNQTAGFHAGEGCYKEVAAYLLDHGRFAGVPPTALAECDIEGIINPIEQERVGKGAPTSLETSMGAFQVFQPNDGDAEDFGPGLFPKEAVHKIAILDLRILNADRHPGNILVVRKQGTSVNLVPIDHGFCLPDTIRSLNWPCWMDWPQSKLPLSEETARYVDLLDHEMDSRILEDELEGNIRPAALLNLRLGTTLLQLGVQAGLSLYDIGSLIYSRTPDQERSILERIAQEAQEATLARQGRFDEACHAEEEIFLLDDVVDTCPQADREAKEAFQYKYARNLIQQQIETMVKTRARRELGRNVHKSLSMGRVRSIPEFGRPLAPRRTRASADPVASSPITSVSSTTSPLA